MWEFHGAERRGTGALGYLLTPEEVGTADFLSDRIITTLTRRESRPRRVRPSCYNTSNINWPHTPPSLLQSPARRMGDAAESQHTLLP